MRTAYFLIPLFNESENIGLLAENLTDIAINYEKIFIFVDDCSTDGTVNEIRKHFARHSHHIIEKNRNKGPGDSFNRGLEWILQNGPDDHDIVVTMEADNTSDPAILPDMVSISNLGYDVVLASIYAQGGGFGKTRPLRRTISFVANTILRFAFDIKVLTLSSFYRVYRMTLIRKIKEHHGTIIKESGFISMIEILLKSIWLKASVIEVPMTLHSDNRRGKSKMKLFRTMLGYLNFLITAMIKKKF